MRKVIALMLTICMVMFFVGCSGTQKKKEPISISVMTSFGPTTTNSGAYETLLKEYQAINQNVIVKDNSVTADDKWKSAVRSKFEGGQEPDVMFFFTKSDVKDIIAKDQVVSIDEIREEYPDYASNIKPEAMQAVTELSGKAYCVPVVGFWEGLYCNKELFKRYNIPMITDWNSFTYAIDKFNENGVIPIAASFLDEPNYWIEHSILSVGGVEKHSANPKTPNEIPQEWIDGLKLINELYEKNAFQEDSLTTRHELSVQMFISGEAAMILDGSWMRIERTMQENIQVVAFPSHENVAKTDRGAIAGFSMGFYISRKAWNDPLKRDACVKYVQYMTQDDSIARLSTAGAPAANIEIPYDVLPITKEGFDLCNNNTMEMPIDSRLTKSAWEYLFYKMPCIVKGKMHPKDVLNIMVEHN